MMIIKQEMASVGEEGGRGALLVGVHAGAVAAENSMEGPQDVKNGATIWPSSFSSGYLAKQNHDLEAMRVSPSSLQLFPAVQVWRQPVQLATEKWVKSVW